MQIVVETGDQDLRPVPGKSSAYLRGLGGGLNHDLLQAALDLAVRPAGRARRFLDRAFHEIGEDSGFGPGRIQVSVP